MPKDSLSQAKHRVMGRYSDRDMAMITQIASKLSLPMPTVAMTEMDGEEVPAFHSVVKAFVYNMIDIFYNANNPDRISMPTDKEIPLLVAKLIRGDIRSAHIPTPTMGQLEERQKISSSLLEVLKASNDEPIDI